MDSQEPMTFWDHLDVLRGVLFRVALVTIVASVITFCFKELLFKIILAPAQPDFVVYRWIASLFSKCGADGAQFLDFHVELFSSTLTAQFMTHMKVAFYMGIIIAMPYILYELFGFIAPALRYDERRYSKKMIFSSYLLFMAGVALDYFIIFPTAFRFLGTYQVSPDVPNIITLTSYIEMLSTMTLLMGILFELPIMSWLLARLGIINDAFMKKYRRHAFVAILIIGAAITPTTDVFTLAIVSLPIYLLYEASIIIVRRV